MPSLPNTPTLNEWIALIQQDLDQAKQLVTRLRTSIKKQGFLVDPSLSISSEDYDRAQHLLVSALNNPQEMQQIASKAAIGRITLKKIPNRDDWLSLINADSALARLVCIELESKQALLGINAPQELLRSIESYYDIIHQQS